MFVAGAECFEYKMKTKAKAFYFYRMNDFILIHDAIVDSRNMNEISLCQRKNRYVNVFFYILPLENHSKIEN